MTFLANSPAKAVMPAKTAIQNSQGCIPECVTLGFGLRLYRRSETHKHTLAFVDEACCNLRGSAHFESKSSGLTRQPRGFNKAFSRARRSGEAPSITASGDLRSCCRQRTQIQARSRALVGTRSSAPAGICSWKHQQRCTSASPSPLAMMQALALPHSGHNFGSITSVDMQRQGFVRACDVREYRCLHAASASSDDGSPSKYSVVRRSCSCALSARLTMLRKARSRAYQPRCLRAIRTPLCSP